MNLKSGIYYILVKLNGVIINCEIDIRLDKCNFMININKSIRL